MVTTSRLFSDGSLAINGPFDEYTLSNANYGVGFNGNQSLSLLTQSAFGYGTGDFTIEFWMYINSISLQSVVSHLISDTAAAPHLYLNTPGVLTYFQSGAGRISSATLTTKIWYHVALTRASGSTILYINGSQSGSTYADSTNYGTSNPIAIGDYFNAYPSLNGASRFNGYISNLRIIKGTALYTSAFTPSTSPLTAITNTQLLTCQNSSIVDNSSNAFTITNNGSATVDRVATTFYKNNFSGASQYLRVPYSSAFDFSQSTWTLECWFKANAFDLVILSKDTYGTNFDFCMYVSATSIFSQTAGTAQNYSVTTGLTLSTGVWYHLAMVRNAGTLNYYLNGVKYGAGSGMGITNVSNSYVTLGCFSWNNPSGYMNGSVSNLRMVQGTALYTSNFTPPQNNLTAISGTTFLSYQSPTIIDNSPNAIAITNINGVTVEAPLILNKLTKRQYSDGTFQTLGDIDEYTITNSKYCTSFNGSSQYLTVPSNAAFSFGTGDFTVECWLYTGAPSGGGVTNDRFIFGGFSSSSPAFAVFLNNGGNLPAIWNGTTQYNTTTSVPTNTWTHVAWVRNSSTLNIYINGVLGKTQASYTTNFTTASTWYIGKNDIASDRYFSGYISNLRVVKGVAVYTSEFTPPTSPLTAVSGTSLLTCQNPTIIDNSTNAFTITNNGSVPTNNIQSTMYGATLNGGNYLSIAQAAGAIGTGTFTIEAWVYPTSFSSSPTIMENSYWYQGYNGGWTAYISTSGTIVFSASNGGWNTYPSILVTTGTVSLNVWSHVAIVRDSNNYINVYINGVPAITPVNYSASLNYNNGSIGSSYALRIGAHIADGGFYQGYSGSISNARITSTAVYNGPFLPPKKTLTNIIGTQFLACQSSTFIDNSSNGYGITNVSSVTIFSPIFTKNITSQQVTGGYLIDGEFDEYSYGGNPPASVDYLIVAGGGGGGNGASYQYEGGGGGAGGLLSGTATVSPVTIYSFVVGGGGGGTGYGSNSTGLNLTAIGGGAGGSYGGGAGGSGGGTWAGSAGSGTAGPPRQGYNGAGGGNNPGGGGGASAAGITNGAGGAGAEWPTGSGTYYAGGGAGSYGGSSVGGGGAGGTSPVAGTVNTGGGGGAGVSTVSSAGAGGGSGVIIIRYPNTYDDAKVTTGSPTYTNIGGYKTYKFTSSGSITF